MKIIDLTLPIYPGMPVYPGDPEVKLDLVANFDEDGWNMRHISMVAHQGTHLNAPIHGMKSGKTLDDYTIEDFIVESYLYTSNDDIKTNKGIIFNQDITWEIAYKIAEIRPKLVGSWATNDIDVDIEKYLFKEDILLYERIANTDKLPRNFIFYGIPLRIKDGDGSPVRAFAILG